jgi:hypothetical protein
LSLSFDGPNTVYTHNPHERIGIGAIRCEEWFIR